MCSSGTDFRLTRGGCLFASDGFASVPTQAIVDAAGVTRGALYHQFGDKTGLFATVCEDVERDLVATITTRIVEAAPQDQLSAMRVGALDEAALYISRATDAGEAFEQTFAVCDRLISGIAGK